MYSGDAAGCGVQSYQKLVAIEVLQLTDTEGRVGNAICNLSRGKRFLCGGGILYEGVGALLGQLKEPHDLKERAIAPVYRKGFAEVLRDVVERLTWHCWLNDLTG